MNLVPPAAAVDASTADLLAAVARGDRPAMDALTRRYVDFVYAAAHRQAPADAADVTQAVFLVLASKAATIRAPGLAAWLHQTTRYAAANANRAAKRRRYHEQSAARPEAVMASSLMNEPDPLLELLDEAIAALGDTDRRAVVGRYLLGQNTAAVAAALGLSPKAAQKRIDRAVERLRGRLTTAVRQSTSPAALLPAAAVTAVLTAAAPTPAPAAVAVVAAAPTTMAATLAKGTMSAIGRSQAKAVAVRVAAGLMVVGAGVAVIRLAAVPVPPATTHMAATGPASAPSVASTAPSPAASATRADLAGVTIDLIGMAAYPSAGGPWYDFAGRPLARRPYDQADLLFDARPGRVVREFAVDTDPAKVNTGPWSAAPNAATLRLSAERSSGGPGQSAYIETVNPDAPGKFGRLSVVMSMPADQPATLWFEIAAGPWTTRVTAPRDGDDVILFHQSGIRRVRVTHAFADEQGVASVGYCTAEFDADADVRLAAIDTDGRVHLPVIRTWHYRPPFERTAEPAMDAVVPAMNLAKAPLGQIIDRVRNEAKVSVTVDWAGLKAAGIDESTPVSARLPRRPLYEWLSRLLQNIRATAGRLEFDVKDGMVLIGVEDPRRPRRSWYAFPGLPIAKLDRVEVQTRSFDRWAAFEGLNPQLGQPSRMTVRTSETAPNVDPARPGATR